MQEFNYIDEIKKIHKNAGNEISCDNALLRHKINQHFVDQRKFSDIIDFHRKALKLVVNKDFFEIIVQIVEKDNQSITSELVNSIYNIEKAIIHEHATKAIYFEYDDSGTDYFSSAFFHCLSFDKNDDEWACDFNQNYDGLENYPSMELFYEMTEEPIALSVIENYLDAQLLTICMTLWSTSTLAKLPFGFACHDCPIVSLC